MNAKHRPARVAAVLLAALVAAAPAWSAPPEGKGQGRGHAKADKHERKARKPLQPGAWFNDRNRDAVRGYYASAGRGGKPCPPGLAKKGNGCLPPGQAKKWHIGQPLPGDVVWVAPPRDVIVSLPPVPAGHRYVQVAGDILLVAVGSMMVIDGIDGLLGR